MLPEFGRLTKTSYLAKWPNVNTLAIALAELAIVVFVHWFKKCDTHVTERHRSIRSASAQRIQLIVFIEL